MEGSIEDSFSHSEEQAQELLRFAMRQWATGVTIVTAEFDGLRHGMTVSSFTSIDLTPPLVLVSLEQEARTHQLVKESQAYGVNILKDNQHELSDRFAGRIPLLEEDRFNGLPTLTLMTGAPFLEESLANLDCRVISTIDTGRHTLFIGEVVAVRVSRDGSPLIYYDRNYHRLIHP